MTTAVTTAQPKTFRELITADAYKNQLAQALPRGLTADRMVRVVLTAINKTPALLECTKESLWESVLNCAALGLFPDALGRAYLVPYNWKCQLIIGYKGLIDLAYRSERISLIQIKAVFGGDHFVYDFGLDPKLEHRPCEAPGELTHVYSIVHLKGADRASFDVMRKDEVEAIRKRSPSGNSGPWKTDYAAMAMKTVFRRHSKLLPMSAELAQALDTDHDQSAMDLSPANDAGRFTKDQPTTHETTAETVVEQAPAPGAPTAADCIALAKQLPDEVVVGLLDKYQSHTVAGVAAGSIAALHADLLTATTTKTGGRP